MKVKMKINVISVIILITLVIVLLFISGCTGEQKTEENKNLSDNLTGQLTKEIQTKRQITLDPLRTIPSQSRNQVIIVDFQKFLTEWNEKMHWGLSDQQIEEYNRTLKSGLLMDYQTKPGYKGDIAWDIPDIKTFSLELGEDIGLTKNQSEVFATIADDYYLKGKIAADKPLAIDILSIENCSIQIDRGKQKEINITYQYTAWVSPGTVRFTSTQTPLTLAFNPPEFTVKPYTEYQAVATIIASPSLEPGLYQFGITINGKNTSEVHCKESGSDLGNGQRMVNVTVL
jgi:hypothetical protein